VLGSASTFSLAASALYVLVAIVCMSCAVASRNERQQAWHFRLWLGLAILFLSLALLRFLGAEEILRDLMRAALRADAAYERRREFQRPIVAGLVAILAAVCFWIAYRVARSVKGRRNFAVLMAGACGAGMVILALFRLISLHDIDALLYGPLKLNWIADIGMSVTALGAAIFYLKVVRAKRGGRRN